MVPKEQKVALVSAFEGAWLASGRPRRHGGRRRRSEYFCEARAVSTRLRASNAVISMAVIDEKPFTRECITKSLQSLDERLYISSFASCEDCLQSTTAHDLILYYAHQSIVDWSPLYNQLLPLKRLLRAAPVIILSDVDCPESMLAIFESGARGFIPTEQTTLDQIIEIIALVKAGGVFVPPSSLALQSIEGKLAPRGLPSQQLSRSEVAVLDRLKLGKANKIIAHELRMSESTVKLHIGRIMKKLKATNRTEVVCRAYGLAASGLHFDRLESLTGAQPPKNK